MRRKTSLRPPKSYVIRVYGVIGWAVTGQIEDVNSGAVRAFSSADELWAAIGAAS